MCGLLDLCNLCFKVHIQDVEAKRIKSTELKGSMKKNLSWMTNSNELRLMKTSELSQSEKIFREARLPHTMKAMQELLEDDKRPTSVEETPTIALVISGGGYRAMSTSCGATEALMENGLFDVLMYCVGLSGSVWYLSTTYLKKSFSSKERLISHHDWIRTQLGKKINFNPKLGLVYAFKSMFASRKLSLVDLFGTALRDVFLPEHKSAKLSSLQEYVNEAKVPFPIFSAAHVMNHYPVVNFWEEVELTPFEAAYPSYRLLVPIELLSSVWQDGILSEIRSEPMLHYVMGFCGCAFAILLYHLNDATETKAENFWGFVKDMIGGVWGGTDPSPIVPTSRILPAPPPPAMTEDEFKDRIWPVLEEAAKETGEELEFNEAYEMYLYRYNSEDFKWIENLLRMAGGDDEELGAEGEWKPDDRDLDLTGESGEVAGEASAMLPIIHTDLGWENRPTSTATPPPAPPLTAADIEWKDTNILQPAMPPPVPLSDEEEHDFSKDTVAVFIEEPRDDQPQIGGEEGHDKTSLPNEPSWPAPQPPPPTGREWFGRNLGPVRRTGFLPNPIFGMSSNLLEKYMLNDQPVSERKPNASGRIAEKEATYKNEILVVDAGIGCNVPAIHAARPQRKVDIILVVDCESKSTDLNEAFQTLEILQKQMYDNNMKFPPIDIDDLKQDAEKEYYLFEDADDPDCPVVIWFTLYNVRFRHLLNAPRSEEHPPVRDGKLFNDFDVTPDLPEYDTTNLQYAPRDMDRLRELMKHNITQNIQIIKDKMGEKVIHLRSKAKSPDEIVENMTSHKSAVGIETPEKK